MNDRLILLVLKEPDETITLDAGRPGYRIEPQIDITIIRAFDNDRTIVFPASRLITLTMK